MLCRNKYKLTLFLFLVPVLTGVILFGFCSKNSVDPEAQAFYSGGIKRSFGFHIPSGFDPDSTYPAIFAFHGAGSSGYDFMVYTNLNRVSDRQDFIIIYPDAASDNWAEGNGGEADRLGIDDVGFVKDIIDYLETEKKIKLGKIFAVGYSQGGFFAHRLSIDLEETITAYATVASSMSYKVYNRYRTEDKMPVMMFFGTVDPVFFWGGIDDAGVLSYISQDILIQTIVDNNNCDPTPDGSYIIIDDNLAKAIETMEYKNNEGKTLVYYNKVVNGDHEWHLGGGLLIEDMIVSFFLSFLGE